MTSITIVKGDPIVARSKGVHLITPLTLFLFIISQKP